MTPWSSVEVVMSCRALQHLAFFADEHDITVSLLSLWHPSHADAVSAQTSDAFFPTAS